MIANGGELGFVDSGELLQRGMADCQRFRPPLLDSSILEVLGVEAEVQSLTVKLWVTSSDSEKSRPELGFWGLMQRNKTGERKRDGD
jgi:hypothetical protein